jgi:transposase
MWTTENRQRYNRDKLRYPSDLTDAEWGLVEGLIAPAKRGGRKRSVNVREVLNSVMFILSAGVQWRSLPSDLPPRSTVHDYLESVRKVSHALHNFLSMFLIEASFRNARAFRVRFS